MSDEMRVALVGVAMGIGLAFDEAWDVVEGLGEDAAGDARQLALTVAKRAGEVAFPR